MRRAIVVFGLAVGAGCGTNAATGASTAGTGTGGSSTGDTDPLLARAESVAVEFCERFVDCGCLAYDDALFGSYDECLASELPSVRSMVQAARDAGLTFDESCADALEQRFRNLGCAPDFRTVPEIVPCKLFYGDGALGEPCVAVDQANGDSCRPELTCREGVCDDNEPRAVGEPCPVDRNLCESGAFCSQFGNEPRTCHPLPAEGDPCYEGFVCPPELYCDPVSTRCVALLEQDAPCTPDGVPCGYGLECGPADGRCRPAPPGAVGDPCTLNACGDGLLCNQVTCHCSTPEPYVCWGGGTEEPKDPLTRGC